MFLINGERDRIRTYSAEATGLQPAYLSKDGPSIFPGITPPGRKYLKLLLELKKRLELPVCRLQVGCTTIVLLQHILTWMGGFPNTPCGTGVSPAPVDSNHYILLHPSYFLLAVRRGSDPLTSGLTGQHSTSELTNLARKRPDLNRHEPGL